MLTDDNAIARSVLTDLLDRGILGLEEFEDALHKWAMSVCLLVMRGLFARLDSVLAGLALADGLRFKAMHGHTCICRFGRFHYERTMVQAARNGAVRSPLAEKLGLHLGFVTPTAARLSVRMAAGLSTRAATQLLVDFGEVAPSRTTLMRLVLDFGDAVEDRRPEVLALLAEQAGPPENAVAVAIQLDGVMVQMVGERRAELREKARQDGRKVGGPIGKEEASVGALVYYDAEGNRISTVRVARMPEREKVSLQADLKALLEAVRARRPDLTVIAGSDGAPNHWTFLSSLGPDHEYVDFYHSMEHIQKRLNVALGVGTHRNQELSARLRKMLHDGDHPSVFSALERVERENRTYKERKTRGRGAQPTFYERHVGRMAYAALRA